MSVVIAETTALANGNLSLCDTSSGTFLNDAADKVINNDAQINALADDQDEKGVEIATSEQATTINESQSSSALSKLAKSGGEEGANNEIEMDTFETAAKEPNTPTTRRASTTSRFKEKRPEPLKLNSNLNQDIPLDLSVKSAGNVPSSALGSIFNLGQLNQMAPLETPRIQWQDTDSLLASTKSRLFSSSTNASHRARISSVMGESPPTTPGTPLMDVMFSSTAATSIHRLPSDPSYSAILASESPLHSFLTSPFDLDKLHILDRLSQPNKQDHYQHHNHHHHHNNQTRTDVRGVPRRSCSTDSLHILTNSGRSQTIAADTIGPNRTKIRHEGGYSPNCLGLNSKKNSISPLATKSFSNKSGSGLNSPTKFPYTHQQLATDTESHQQQQSPTANSNGKSLTPTSVATVNLFNIHLSSSSESSRQSPVDPTLGPNKSNGHQQYKSPSFPSLDQEACTLDVANSLLYCQQQQQNARTPLLGFSSSSNGLDQNSNQLLGEHYHRQQSNPSISSTATLNTPTLISPSQVKANQLCLLPSPTLSPMPSVFDIPSPFLMFAPTSAQVTLQQHGSPSSSSPINSDKMNKQSAGQSLRDDASKKTRCEARQMDKSSVQTLVQSRPEKYSAQSSKSSPPNSIGAQDVDMLKDQSDSVVIRHGERNLVKNDLSHLITSAEEKTATRLGSKVEDSHEDEDLQRDIDMVIDDDNEPKITSSANIPTKSYTLENRTRPSTVIPHICISYHAHAKSLSNLRDSQPKANKLANQTGALSDSNCLSLVDCNETGGEFNRQREQRNLWGKGSLSPRAFHARVRNYHNERLESSSAPPNVCQRRRRSKIKTATDSFLEMVDNKSDKDNVSKLMIGPDNRAPNLSQSVSSLNQAHNNRVLNRPYPEMRSRLDTSNQQFDAKPDVIGEISFLNGRSSSAEPAIYSANHSNKAVPCTTTSGTLTNFQPSQSASHLCSGQNNSNFTGQSQQQGQHLRGSSLNQNLDCQSFQDANQPNHHQQQHQPQHHHQQQYHSLANHQFHQNTHANNYDHHNNQHHQPYNAQQLYSMSASELQRLQYSRHGCPTQEPSLAASVIFNKTDSIVLPQRIPNYQQQHYTIQQQHQNTHQHHQQQHLQHQQHSSFPQSLQNLPSLTTGEIINSQTGAPHRVSCEGQFLSHAPGSAQSQSLINQIGFQPTAAQVLCEKFETSNHLNHCQDMIARRDTFESSLSKEQASILTCAKLPAGQQKGSGLINQYIVDIESRSESRSNSSLDFTNSLTSGSGIRSNSIASSNLGAKKYHCDQCSKSFTRSDMLTRHRRLHSGDRPFQCTECKQEFSRSDHLSTHMRTHTGEKPYKCKLCTYSACRKDMITRHLKVHNRSPNLDE